MGQVGGMFGIPTQSGRHDREVRRRPWATSARATPPPCWVSAAVIVVILGSKAISPKIPGRAHRRGRLDRRQLAARPRRRRRRDARRGARRPAELRLPLGHLVAVRRRCSAPAAPSSSSCSPRAPPPRGPTPRSTRSPSTRTSTSSGSAWPTRRAGLSRHLRRQRQPDQDPDGRRRRRPQPAGEPDHGRHRARRAALPHQAAAVHAQRRARVGRVPHRHRAGRHQGPARDPARCAATSSSSPRITGLLVVVVGVEQAIVVAIVVSVIDHLRRSYAPKDCRRRRGRRTATTARCPVAAGGQLVPGPGRLPVHLGAVLRQREPVQRGGPRPGRRRRPGGPGALRRAGGRRRWSTSTTAAG